MIYSDPVTLAQEGILEKIDPNVAQKDNVTC